jgi:hypothetical protein
VADGILVRIPLPVMATILAGLALGVEVLGYEARFGAWSLVLLALPAALAVAFLLEYRTLPHDAGPRRTKPTPAPAPEPPEEEFIDPVEEADRLEHAATVADPSAPETASDVPEPDGR